MNVKKGLEKILKQYVPVVGITALETPLHEGVHAGLASILPHVHCSGISLNNSYWYSKPLEILTLGYCKSMEMNATTGGFANISSDGDTLSDVSNALVSSGPEILSMTLGFYWIASSINNVRQRGNKLLSLTKAYCGVALASSAFYYSKEAALHPEAGDDHVNFTRSILDIAHLPSGAANYVTFAGTVAMALASLYAANFLVNRTKN